MYVIVCCEVMTLGESSFLYKSQTCLVSLRESDEAECLDILINSRIRFNEHVEHGFNNSGLTFNEVCLTKKVIGS